MKFRFTIAAPHAALIAVLLAVSPAGSGSLTLLGAGKASVGGGAYVGPLDVASGAAVAYCLRACSNAKIGSNVIDIKRASDSTTQTFVSLTNGSLDIASITTFLTATTGVVTKWWDQSGNNNHAVNNNAGTQPAFTISGTGLGTKPTITFDGVTSDQDLVTGSVTAATAFVSAVTVRRGGTSSFTAVIGANAGPPGLLYNNSANNMAVFAGSVPTFAVPDNAFHAIGALFNGASSQGYVNGVGSGALSAGSTTFGSTLLIGAFNPATPLTGDISEVILWASDQSANASALSANQRGASGYNF